MKNSIGEGGNYIGQNGAGITLNTFLGGDGSPSDRLVITGGTGTGPTSLTIHNTTGPGAPTLANGILVVEAVNGGTTTPGTGALTAMPNPETRSSSPIDCAPAPSTIFLF